MALRPTSPFPPAPAVPASSPFPPAPPAGSTGAANGSNGHPARGHRAQGAAPAEMISVAADIDEMACDGGGGPLGHPLVYYAFDGRDRVECLYCDRIFVKAPRK